MLPKDFQFNLGQEVYVLRYRQSTFARRIKETCEYCLGTRTLIAKNNIEIQCSECWGRGYNTKKNR